MNHSAVRFGLLVLVLAARLGVAAPVCDKPWMFFDLGLNTLLDTSHEDSVTGEMTDVRWMPGAYAYLTRLKALGYHIGLLVDVPENWGGTDEKALAKTASYIKDAWIKSDPKGMDWSVFTPGLLFFPPKNKYRKAAGSLYLFEKALDHAGSCPAIHQATRLREVQLARKAGMKAYQVGVPGRPYYLPIESIPTFAN